MKPELMAVIIIGLIVVCLLAVLAIRKIISRKQNRISVRPQLKIIREEQEGKPIRILLKNIGRGPAIMDSFNVIIDSNSSNGNNETTMEEAVRLIGMHGLDILTFTLDLEEALSVNENHFLFEANPINSIEYEKICSALSRLTFKIKYRSIYNETFWL